MATLTAQQLEDFVNSYTDPKIRAAVREQVEQRDPGILFVAYAKMNKLANYREAK